MDPKVAEILKLCDEMNAFELCLIIHDVRVELGLLDHDDPIELTEAGFNAFMRGLRN